MYLHKPTCTRYRYTCIQYVCTCTGTLCRLSCLILFLHCRKKIEANRTNHGSNKEGMYNQCAANENHHTDFRWETAPSPLAPNPSLLLPHRSCLLHRQPRPLRREYRQHVQHDSVVHDQNDLHVGDRCWVLFGRSSRQTMRQPRPLRREYRQHVQHDGVIHDQHDLHVGDRCWVLFGRSSRQNMCSSF